MSTAKRPRDSQRQRLYDAEDAYWGSTRDGTMDTVPLLQAYVDSITTTAWFQNRWPGPPITVADGRRRRSACAVPHLSQIRMPLWSRGRACVLHEIAHICVYRAYPPDSVAIHGREFAAVYLELVGRFMGVDHKRGLKDTFKRRGVKYGPPRQKRPMSPERRQEASERLAAARVKREAQRAALRDADPLKVVTRDRVSFSPRGDGVHVVVVDDVTGEELLVQGRRVCGSGVWGTMFVGDARKAAERALREEGARRPGVRLRVEIRSAHSIGAVPMADVTVAVFEPGPWVEEQVG